MKKRDFEIRISPTETRDSAATLPYRTVGSITLYAGYGLMIAGLLLALEPWIMADTDELVTDDDGWTLRSATGCRTAS